MTTVTSKLTKRKYFFPLPISPTNRIDHIRVDVPASFKSRKPVNVKVAQRNRKLIAIKWI